MEINEKVLAAKEKLLEKFRHRERMTGQDRLPPGQKLTQGFPVLDLGIRPSFDPKTWTFRVEGEVENPMTWTWEEFRRLPKVEQISDFHCVTRWSKYGVHWGGVKMKTIAEIVMPKQTARFVIAHCDDGGYTTNMPMDEVLRDDVLLAYELDGEPLPPDHGGPMRLLVPKLYAWKSAKFLRTLRFVERDEPGFWETRGYNNHADPWKEERHW
jgi:DMSO/TMAO reductase YedYZ molybdopterin-dependent catalytic subunit